MSEPNGKGDVDTVILTRNRTTGHVDISGSVQDVDMALDMLGRATRFMDVQYRIAAAVQAQEQIKQRNEDMARARRLTGLPRG